MRPRPAYTLVAILTLGVAGTVAALQGASTPPAAPGGAARIIGPERPPPARGDARELDVVREPAVERLARRFLDAYRRYDVGRIDVATVERLAQTSTPELLDELRTTPPRPSPGRQPRLAKVAALQVLAAGSRRWTVLAELRRGRRRVAVRLTVAGAGDARRITTVGPA